MVAHTCNPSTLGGRGGWITRSKDRDHPREHGETPSLLINTKISQAWWRAPVVPASRRAEVGGSLGLSRLRLQWAEIAPLHSSLGDGARPHLKGKKKRKEKEIETGKIISPRSYNLGLTVNFMFILPCGTIFYMYYYLSYCYNLSFSSLKQNRD